MSSTETDELDASLGRTMQHGLMIAAQIGREASRLWQKRLEQKARMSSRDAARAQLAFDAERRTARAALAAVQQDAWWENATPAKVIDAYRTATAWERHDDVAKQVAGQIRDEAAKRWGVDTARLISEQSPHLETVLQAAPERLAAAREWAERTNWADTIPESYPEATHVRNLLADFAVAEAQDRAAAARAAGDQAATEAALIDGLAAQQEADQIARLTAGPTDEDIDWYRANVSDELDTADQTASRAADEPAPELMGPDAADDAWYAENVLGATTPDTPTETLDVHEPAPATRPLTTQQPAVADTATAQRAAGERLRNQANHAWNEAQQQAALSERMRAAGAPEPAIRAREFGDAQVGQNPKQAAAGAAVRKVRTSSPQQQKQTAAKKRTR